MNGPDLYRDFKLLICKHSDLIAIVLSNVFILRLIGNKPLGDLAEMGVVPSLSGRLGADVLPICIGVLSC